jgi:diphosphomevalonate decarboxylase
MHAVMMTQTPPLYFWSGATVSLMKKTIELRSSGVGAYFTMDAGENVHIICQKRDEEQVFKYFQEQTEVREIIKNNPAIGARVINNL